MNAKITFVLGGARSGKSRFAEQLCADAGLQKFYIATGRAWDDEMAQRIAAHRADRGDSWTTLEAPLDLSDALKASDRPQRIVLVDCLTLWLTNLMMENRDIGTETDGLAAALDGISSKVVLVSNEVGLGIVPENRMAREFRDHAGKIHQRIAALADEVYFVAAGLPLKMKG